jgi:iron complex outermembrane receptor protein
VDLNGKFNTGKITHTLLFGADYDNYTTVANTFNATSYNNNLANESIKGKNIYDTINVYGGGSYLPRYDIPYLPLERVTTSPIERYGIYIQDLVALTNNIKLLAGVRYSNQHNKQATV